MQSRHTRSPSSKIITNCLDNPVELLESACFFSDILKSNKKRQFRLVFLLCKGRHFNICLQVHVYYSAVFYLFMAMSSFNISSVVVITLELA